MSELDHPVAPTPSHSSTAKTPSTKSCIFEASPRLQSPSESSFDSRASSETPPPLQSPSESSSDSRATSSGNAEYAYLCHSLLTSTLETSVPTLLLAEGPNGWLLEIAQVARRRQLTLLHTHDFAPFPESQVCDS